MATELITRTWCDLHLADGEQVPAVTFYRFGIDVPGGGKWKWITLDVCQQHADEQMEPMAELLVKVGAAFEAPAAPPKRSSLPKLPTPRPVVPAAEPADAKPATSRRDGGPFVCDTCGREFATGQARSLHRRRAKDHPEYDPRLATPAAG